MPVSTWRSVASSFVSIRQPSSTVAQLGYLFLFFLLLVRQWVLSLPKRLRSEEGQIAGDLGYDSLAQPEPDIEFDQRTQW